MEEPEMVNSRSGGSAGLAGESPEKPIGPSRPLRLIFQSTTVELPNEISAMLVKLMVQTGHQPSELFTKAMLLYQAAVDARGAGKSLAILDPDGGIDQEITGL